MSCSPSREAVAQWLVALVPGVWVRLVLPAQATAPSVKLRSGSSAQSGASRAVAPTRDGTNDTGGVAGAPAGHATMHATRHETLARRSSPHTCSEFNLCVPYEDAATGSVCTLDASHRSKRLPTASVKKSRAERPDCERWCERGGACGTYGAQSARRDSWYRPKGARSVLRVRGRERRRTWTTYNGNARLGCR